MRPAPFRTMSWPLPLISDRGSTSVRRERVVEAAEQGCIAGAPPGVRRRHVIRRRACDPRKDAPLLQRSPPNAIATSANLPRTQGSRGNHSGDPGSHLRGVMHLDERRWCGRPDSNRHRPSGPTDFRTRYGFRRPCRAKRQGLGSGLSLHHGRHGCRCCPSSLYTFPLPGLARDCLCRFPRL